MRSKKHQEIQIAIEMNYKLHISSCEFFSYQKYKNKYNFVTNIENFLGCQLDTLTIYNRIPHKQLLDNYKVCLHSFVTY